MSDLGSLLENGNEEIWPELIGASKLGKAAIEDIVRYMNSCELYSVVLSPKYCKVCDRIAGGHNYHSDGVWIWADWVVHFITDHQVLLPESFIRHLISKGVLKND